MAGYVMVISFLLKSTIHKVCMILLCYFMIQNVVLGVIVVFSPEGSLFRCAKRIRVGQQATTIDSW